MDTSKIAFPLPKFAKPPPLFTPQTMTQMDDVPFFLPSTSTTSSAPSTSTSSPKNDKLKFAKLILEGEIKKPARMEAIPNLFPNYQ